MRFRQADLGQIPCRAPSFYSCMILGKLPDLPSRKQGLAWGRRTAWFLGGFLVLEGAWGTPQGNQVMPGSPRWVPEAGLVSRATRRQQVQHHSCPRHPQVLGGGSATPHTAGARPVGCRSWGCCFSSCHGSAAGASWHTGHRWAPRLAPNLAYGASPPCEVLGLPSLL